MSTRSLLLTGLAGLALLATAVAPAARAAEQLVDGIAAQVGTRIVLISEVMRMVGPQEAMMREGGAPDQAIMKLRAEALDRLIEDRLIEGVVSQLELYADEEEIDQTIETIARDNGLTLEQLYASVVFHGMTREEYRQQIKEDLERRNVVNTFVGSDVKVDDLELRLAYDERFGDMPASSDNVHVRQLLISYGRGTKRDADAACEVVSSARRRLDEGESFEELARELSEVAPADGGDIGWLPTDELAGWMSEALDGLGDGDVSDPILLPFGCSMLQLVERRQVERLTFEQAKPALYQELWNRQLEEGYREWMDELRDKTYIDRRGYFADAAQFGEATFPVEATESAGAP
ncbi:MAG: peptidylprolyl isomerase [Myxococcota bacterium]